MKKHFILCIGLLVAVLLLLCASASADQPPFEELQARIASMTEAEKIASLNKYFKDGIPTCVKLGEGASIDNGKLMIREQKINVNNPDGSLFQTASLNMTGSYVTLRDDIVMIEEKSSSWFSESGSLSVGGSGSVVHGNVALTAGAPVLILETNGDLRGYYAGAGTNSSTLVLGEKMNVYRGFAGAHMLTYDIGPTFPLPWVFDNWISGSFSTNPFGGYLTLHIDVDFDFSYWYLGWVGVNLRDNSIEIKYRDNKVELYSDEEIAHSIKLFTVSKESYYVFSISMDVILSFEGTGKGSTKFDTNVKEGYGYDLWFYDGLISLENFAWVHDANFDISSTDQVGDFYIAYGYEASATALEIGLAGSYKGGVVLEGGISTNHQYPGDTTGNIWHGCEDYECIHGDAHVRFGPLAAELVCLGYSTPIGEAGQKDLDPFTVYYTSKTFNDSDMHNPCPHKAYKLNTEVADTAGKKLQNVSVSYADVPEHYEDVASAVTGSDGKAVLYAPTGNYNVTAKATSKFDPSIVVSQTLPIEKTTDVQDLSFALDVPTKHVYFKNPASGTAKNWPKDIDFQPFYSEDVGVPDTIPTLSGRQFAGWNTEKDGSGTSYQPGATIHQLNDDLTLYAQWKIAGDDWYVIYNANGGTKAPDPQIIRRGKDAVLTKELPDGGSLIFRGWAKKPDAAEAEYQPGDTLPYDSSKNVVVLYALWNLSPVPEPIHIAFDANGAPNASLPADVWFEQGSWLQLQAAVAPLGSAYAFRGWSEDPDAEDPEFLAGHSYHFYRSVLLYAIWENLGTVTLTFRDSLPGAVSGIPDPITIVPSMSRNVKIPSRIPEKSGRVFIGWNTKKDGSGKSFAPGTMFMLQKNTTLWAQWKLAGDDWYVIYDANGGTKAPNPQIIRKGKDAVLTTELPENGSLTFKGWATKPDGAKAEYQPGDTLPYDSSKDVVVLYALWHLSPVSKPILISFDANGGLPDTLPQNISVPKSVWFRLPAEEPGWDAQHDFLGWSTNSQATEPEWKAGGMAIFEEDTTLYAIWYAHYRVIAGAGSVWTRGSGVSQRFIADGNVKYFKELRIDGHRFMDGVEISSGSTIADISANAMEKLSVGTHTVTFVYRDGEASAEFSVQKAIPKTGDPAHPTLWLLLILIGIAGLALSGARSRTSEKKK